MKHWREVARHWPVALLLLAGILLRLLWLGDVPGGLNQDEASIGYDAWAILHYGIDRNGFSWPVHLVAWGSGQNALYAYLSMPFLAVFGLSVTSLRLLAACIGILTLLLFWLLGRKLDRGMGLCALLLIVTSPWHLMASRWALESNILPAIVLLSVWLFAGCRRERAYSLPLACVVLTVAVYAYGPAYMFAPLFMACALVMLWQERAAGLVQLLAALVCAALVALPMMGFLLNNAVGTGTLQIGPFSLPHYSGPARYGSIFLPFAEGGLMRTLENGRLVLSLMLLGRDDGMPANAIPGWGAQYAWLLPFSLWGAMLAIKPGAARIDRLMLAWLGCALLTAVMTEANINRINLVWLPLLWMSARGLWCLADRPLLQRTAMALLVLSACLLASQLFGDWNRTMSEAFFRGLEPAIARAVEVAPADAKIVVTDRANMPYISALFASRTPPDIYLRTAVIPDRHAAFQQVLGFERFHFGLGAGAQDATTRYWVVHRSELAPFSPARFSVQSFDDYALVTRADVAGSCERGLDGTLLHGEQDWGTLGIDGPVSSSGAGFLVAGKRLLRGVGVHGNSHWSFASPQPMQGLRGHVGISDDSACSDGLRFVVKADGRQVFDSGVLQTGQIAALDVDLQGARSLELETHAGATNRCDHGNWLEPVIRFCQPESPVHRRGR